MLNHEVAIVSTLFDYPDYYMPIFWNKAITNIDKKDIHIIRYPQHSPDKSLYEKLYYYKIVKNIEYYKTKLLNKYKYIIFADATDTNIYKSLDGIVDVFESFHSNIVFCGEKFFWPPVNEHDLYNNKPKISDRFYLNSGLYMGYVDKIIEHMETIIKENRTSYDDQGHWTIEYLLNYDIEIDQTNKLFFSTLNSKNDIVINDSIQIKNFDPFWIHDNGPFNDDTIKISELLK